MKYQLMKCSLGLLAVSLVFAPSAAAQGGCGTCQTYFFGMHTVCGWAPWVDLHDAHCETSTPMNCGSHAWCHEEDDVEPDPVLEQLLAGKADIGAEELRAALLRSDRIILRLDRAAVQVLSCNRSAVVVHVPIDPRILRLVVQ